MEHLFPYDNIVVGVLIGLIGFGAHWIGQLISVINWQYAIRVGLQESGAPKEYKVYEHATAVADVLIGWVYGVTVVGLFLDAGWGYKLAWIPGSILVYHSFNFWFYTRNRIRDGHKLESDALRIGWALANFATGVLTMLVAWKAG